MPWIFKSAPRKCLESTIFKRSSARFQNAWTEEGDIRTNESRFPRITSTTSTTPLAPFEAERSIEREIPRQQQKQQQQKHSRGGAPCCWHRGARAHRTGAQEVRRDQRRRATPQQKGRAGSGSLRGPNRGWRMRSERERRFNEVGLLIICTAMRSSGGVAAAELNPVPDKPRPRRRAPNKSAEVTPRPVRAVPDHSGRFALRAPSTSASAASIPGH